MLKKYQSIFFDFDGVLADSVHIKTKAFYTLYIKYGQDIAAKVVSHHEANGGMSRYEKFPLYHKTYLGQTLSKEEFKELSDKFSDLVIREVVDTKEIKGASWFLNKYYSHINFWVVSATPFKEINKIVRLRKLDKYFRGVYGSPEKKDSLVKKIIEEENLDKETALFIGDAFADYQAAMENKIRFCLMMSDDNREIFRQYKSIACINDFYDLEKLIINHR